MGFTTFDAILRYFSPILELVPTESLTLVWYPKRGDQNLINRISANYDHEHLVDVVIFVIPARLKCGSFKKGMSPEVLCRPLTLGPNDPKYRHLSTQAICPVASQEAVAQSALRRSHLAYKSIGRLVATSG